MKPPMMDLLTKLRPTVKKNSNKKSDKNKSIVKGKVIVNWYAYEYPKEK